MIGKRLTELYNYLVSKNILQSKKDFADLIGVDHRNLNKYINGDVNYAITSSNYDLLKKYNISMDWLLTGQGEMFNSQLPSQINDNVKMVTDHVQIPILDIKASAGYGIAGVDNPNVIDYLDMSKHILGQYKPEQVVCLQITGDSMEPDFRSGDYVLCAIGCIETNGFYVININGNILFKRLQFIKQEKIIVKSINPAYDPEEITSDEKGYFGIIGKVFRHIRTI